MVCAHAAFELYTPEAGMQNAYWKIVPGVITVTISWYYQFTYHPKESFIQPPSGPPEAGTETK